MKVYTCYALAHISYFGEIWLLRYWPKCAQPIRIFKSAISPEQIGEVA